MKLAAAVVADSAVPSEDLLTGEFSHLIDADSDKPAMPSNKKVAPSDKQSAVSTNLSEDSSEQRPNNKMAVLQNQKDIHVAANKE